MAPARSRVSLTHDTFRSPHGTLHDVGHTWDICFPLIVPLIDAHPERIAYLGQDVMVEVQRISCADQYRIHVTSKSEEAIKPAEFRTPVLLPASPAIIDGLVVQVLLINYQAHLCMRDSRDLCGNRFALILSQSTLCRCMPLGKSKMGITQRKLPTVHSRLAYKHRATSATREVELVSCVRNVAV